jgi:cysteine-rich repeat protein
MAYPRPLLSSPRTSLALLSSLLGACDATGGPPDASRAPDAAILLDGGPDDGGSLDAATLDAATLDAAREAPSDASSDAGPDAALALDAGVDAAVPPTDYPLELVLPDGTTMVTVTRLGDGAFVLASVRDTDPSTGEGEALVLQRIARLGHSLVPEPERVLAEVTLDPGSDNPIQLAGAIGEEHFFLVVADRANGLHLRFFAVRGGAFVDLGTTDLGDDAFLSAHPVDERRHLLGFRTGNSGEPFRYRLLVRDGDALALGPPLSRPAPRDFSGLSPSESQADPALLRVGASTFVEARPGYVSLPGDLATWMLTVGDDDTLTATGPVVHATVDRTMSPEVAADGRGGAFLLYHPYGSGDVQWYGALYDHATRTLGPELEAVRAGASPIRAHQGESTDRHLGDAYYLRPVGGPSGVVPLLRVDARDGTATTAADVPGMWQCYRAPQLVRAGTIAALTGCDRVVFLDLLPSCGDRVIDATESCDDGAHVDGDGCSAGCTLEPGAGPG